MKGARALLSGRLDAKGHTRLQGVPNEAAEVYFGESPKPFIPEPVLALAQDEEAMRAELAAIGWDAEHNDLDALIERESGRSADV